MIYTRTSPILNANPTPIDTVALHRWASGNEAYNSGSLYEYIEAVVSGSLRMGIDPVVMLAQSALETDWWRSGWWATRLNPAGIGITGDTDQNVASQSWANGTLAARGHLAHMVAYVWGGYEWTDHWPAEWFDPTTYDKRFQAPVDAEYFADTLDDLNGTWAIDPEDNYGGKIAARANEIIARFALTGETMTYDYSKATMPPLLDINVAESKKFAGYIKPDDHIIRAFFIHSAYGYLESTSRYFQQGYALTDYMAGNLLDGKALDGQLRRFNNPFGPRYSHSSGPVSNPIDDAAKFLELFGPSASAINMFTTALERTCTPSGAGVVTEAEHKTRVHLIAWHANWYGKYLYEKTGKHLFTCDTFPLIPHEMNRSFLIYHGEANAGKRNTCPDPNVRATLGRIIADVRTLMAGWQKGADVIAPEVPPEAMPEYAKPVPIPALATYMVDENNQAVPPPAYVTIGNDTFVLVNDKVRAKRGTPRRQYASETSKTIGPDIEKGLEFAVSWLFLDEKGVAWYITPYWTRVAVSDTERISDQV